MDESYFLKRVLEELERAEQAQSARERAIRIRVCRHYGELLLAAQERERIHNGK